MKNLCNTFLPVLLFILLLMLLRCTPKFTQPETPIETLRAKGSCTLEPLTLNSDTEGFDPKQTFHILSELRKMGEENSSVFSSNRKKFILNYEIESTINQIITHTNKKEFKVSQSVQDIMVALRRLGCDIQMGVFADNEKNAQETYLELISQVVKKEKEFLPALLIDKILYNEMDTIFFSVSNFNDKDYPLYITSIFLRKEKCTLIAINTLNCPASSGIIEWANLGFLKPDNKEWETINVDKGRAFRVPANEVGLFKFYLPPKTLIRNSCGSIPCEIYTYSLSIIYKDPWKGNSTISSVIYDGKSEILKGLNKN